MANEVFDRNKLKDYIDDENGIQYHKNIPLDGYVITYGESFITFAYREINGFNIAIINYIYVLDKNAFYQLMAFCIKMWEGYKVKMIYYREHRRKSNAVKSLSTMDFLVTSVKKNNWKHPWVSTNGYDESDCIEVFSKNKESIAAQS